MRLGRMFVGALLLSAGCTHLQKPYNFNTSESPSKPAVAEKLAAALEQVGADVAERDDAKGVVYTAFQDTIRGCSHKQGSATVKYRFLASGSENGAVMVRVDSQCCPPEGFDLGPLQIRTWCQPLMKLYGFQQEELDALGEKLEAALSEQQ